MQYRNMNLTHCKPWEPSFSELSIIVCFTLNLLPQSIRQFSIQNVESMGKNLKACMYMIVIVCIHGWINTVWLAHLVWERERFSAVVWCVKLASKMCISTSTTVYSHIMLTVSLSLTEKNEALGGNSNKRFVSKPNPYPYSIQAYK